jgi:hypothetical protein
MLMMMTSGRLSKEGPRSTTLIGTKKTLELSKSLNKLSTLMNYLKILRKEECMIKLVVLILSSKDFSKGEVLVDFQEEDLEAFLEVVLVVFLEVVLEVLIWEEWVEAFKVIQEDSNRVMEGKEGRRKELNVQDKAGSISSNEGVILSAMGVSKVVVLILIYDLDVC